MVTRQRSIGITILGIIQIIGFFLFWLGFLFKGKENYISFMSFASLVYAPIILISGIGLLLLKNWARLIIILLSLTKIIEMSYRFIKDVLRFNAVKLNIILNYMPLLIFCSFMIWFLTKESTRVQFQRKGQGKNG